MQAEPHLKEHPERRQDEGEQNADDIQRAFSGLIDSAGNALDGIWFQKTLISAVSLR
jgi:hypothetical protein